MLKTSSGETLTIVQNDAAQSKRPHKVTAVLKDYPSNTTLVAQIFAAGKSSYAPLCADGFTRPPPRAGITHADLSARRSRNLAPGPAGRARHRRPSPHGQTFAAAKAATSPPR